MSVSWAASGLYKPDAAGGRARAPQTLRLTFLIRYERVLFKHEIKFLVEDSSQESAASGLYRPDAAGVDCDYEI